MHVSVFALRQETFPGSPALDREIEQSIRDKIIPGGVLVVVQNGEVLHRNAYGQRAIEPAPEFMTIDTIFDVASLTKIVATTPSIMKLVEQGKIRLLDPVTAYLPQFQGGNSSITVRDLLTHFSGLRPDLDLAPPWSGYETGINKALIDKPTYPPGRQFVYSDINFALLGEIVQRIGGRPLDQFTREEIYQLLGMHDTMFVPPATLIPRIAPTEFDEASGKILRGIVHDPTARYMGGVAGHAGLFATAGDLTKYADMLLGNGQRAGVRLLSPLIVKEFTSPATPANQPILFGLGFDIDSPFSVARGDLFSVGGFGHTGFTGTSLWIDPATSSYWILLTNRVHPRGAPDIAPLRRRLGTLIAAAIGVAGPRLTKPPP
jgi:CubicO group peptidase (beta-lactamase class C family)